MPIISFDTRSRTTTTLATALFLLLAPALSLGAQPVTTVSATFASSVAAIATDSATPSAPAASTTATPNDVSVTASSGTATLADSTRMIARLLSANGAKAEHAAPVAAAIIKYSRLRSLDPLLVVAVIGVENATLVRHARSVVGAQGVMQVMPHWKRDIHDCGSDLSRPDVNVCFGTRILRIALDQSSSIREALLRYNGCKRSPGCSKYASAVFSAAGRAALLVRDAERESPVTLASAAPVPTSARDKGRAVSGAPADARTAIDEQ